MKKQYRPTPFSELLRRLMLCGLVCTCILTAVSFLIPLISALATSGHSPADSFNSPTAAQLHAILAPVAGLTAVTAGLALPYTAFSWLNKRRSSDFMHPLPVPAHKMFWLHMGAVFAWIIVIFLSSFLAFGLGCLLFGASTQGFWGSFLLQTAKLIASAVLFASCAAAACAVTGTRLANLTVTVIFLFWPAFLYGGFSLAFYARAELIPTTEATLLLPVVHNLSINLPGGLADLLLGFSNVYDSGSAAFGWTSVGVSLLYAAVWVAVGTWLYHRRLSESAGQASPTHLIQHLIRCALTSPVLLLPAFLLAAERTPLIEILDSESMAALVTLLAVTAIFYFASCPSL